MTRNELQMAVARCFFAFACGVATACAAANLWP